MNLKKILPVAFIALLAIIALIINRCNADGENKKVNTSQATPGKNAETFNRKTAGLFFTKHARCRMKCRQITQQEVKQILAAGSINYNKSKLHDPKGATYAIEGTTIDRQHVRIIVAPKERHLSIVTVIDLDVEYQCDCN